MARQDGDAATCLPRAFDPDCLDVLAREEYDHLREFGLTPDEVVRRLKWSYTAVGRRFHRWAEQQQVTA